MRQDARTKFAVNLIMGRLATESGQKLSAADALWEFIKQHDPELAAKAQALADKEEAEKK